MALLQVGVAHYLHGDVPRSLVLLRADMLGEELLELSDQLILAVT